MPPLVTTLNGQETKEWNSEDDLNPMGTSQTASKPSIRKWELVWRNIILFALIHAGAVFGFYFMFTSAHLKTTIFSYVMYKVSGLGITAGVHRLWAHRSYKAKWPLRLFLAFCNTVAFQDAVVDWARDHRMHHKFSETDADPHNANRGFFFSHVGWLLVRKHKEIKEKAHNVDVSDLYADPILFYQKKLYLWLMPLLCFVFPVLIPIYVWNETFINSFALNISRYVFTLNVTWLVNSAAHIFGNKPYDKTINPAENIFVALLALGEGWHNYHHTFPWDYRASELGRYRTNFTCGFIDLMAKVGLAYDLKSVSEDIIEKRVRRTGDGSHLLWGWGDKDQTIEDRNMTTITYNNSKK